MRALLIGLDCAAPELVFERYREAMPNVAALMRGGLWGKLRSSLPPITVPAWASMLSGRDPGELGLYGFRNRVRGSYALELANGDDLRATMIWDRAGAAGRRVAVLCVPPSHPPRPVNGELLSCFLTPDASAAHTHPRELADELRARFGPYRPDVDDYRTDALAGLLEEIYALSTQHFAIAEHVLRTRKPELTTFVDIGLDRFHHAFWAQLDRGGAYANAGREYYAFLDAQIGKLVAAAGDDCAVIVASDHGARALEGGVCVNEWLIERGYLVLHDYPSEVTSFDALLRAGLVDWSRTRAWGEGGYYARVFLNVAGREPAGIVAAADAPALRAKLAEELAQLPGPGGETLTHRIATPEQSYRRVEGFPPELAVFFGDLAYRAIGSVGHRALHVRDNDRGPDGCNHDWDGLFVLRVPGTAARGEVQGAQIYDVHATLLGLLGLPGESDLLGRDWSAAS